jgi:hypothetical protein
MNELNKYVDSLFINYKKDKKAQDLKEEILSNLEAKWADYISQGMDEAEALKKVKNSIINIDGLIDDNKLIYITRFKLESLQVILMYLIIAWIMTIPLLLLHRFTSLNALLIVTVIITGIFYICQSRLYRDLDTIGRIRIETYRRYKKAGWILWGVFYAVCFLWMTGVNFASNIYFSRPIIYINGPYQLAMLAVQYYIPFITILIPAAISHMCSILRKSEVGEVL